MPEEMITAIVERILQKVRTDEYRGMTIPIGISNRHVHLSADHLHLLFGPGYQLSTRNALSQPGQFAAEETVTLVGPKGVLERVRVLGPTRRATQVEISFSDARRLGINPPVRDSGNLTDTPGLTLVGPRGSITLESGVIAALRHIHMTPDDAAGFGLKDGDYVQVRVDGPRGLVFDQVLIRVSPNFSLELHIDTDEANAAGLSNGDTVSIIRPPGVCAGAKEGCCCRPPKG